VSRRTVALGLVLGVAALAGCSALLGGESTAGPDGEVSVTPAPVPTTAVPYPPGVTARRVDASVLAAAHADTLREYNYTLTVEQRIADANGTVSRRDRRRAVAAGGERFTGGYERTLITRVGRQVADDIAYWTNGSLLATRLNTTQGVPSYGSSAAGDTIIDVDGSRRLNRTLDGLAFRVTERTDEGVVLAGSKATVPERFQTPAGVTDPRNVSTTLRVRFDAVVVDWRLTYDARLRGRSVTVIQTFTVVDLGATTVRRPEWVDRAVGNSSVAPS